MAMNITLKTRLYTPDDWNRVCAIHDAARKDELKAASLSDAYLTLEETAENEGFHDYNIHVAEHAGNVLGFVAFSPDELAWLYVDPLFYGHGVGKTLIETALRICGGAMTAQVLDGNLAAIATYKKAGFIEIDHLHGHMPGNETFAVSVTELRHPGLS
jgi:GNAT superfamily N-acetyltransferase